LRILQYRKKELKRLKIKKKHNSELYALLGLIFISFTIPGSVALYSDNQSVQVSNTNEFLEIMEKSQRASLSQQWSPGTMVSGCISPWEFWEFLWRIFNRLKPNIDFTANVTSIFPGETVEFKYKGARNGWYKTYLWDFGDGGESEERNPIHTYDSSGIYNVSLTTIYFGIFTDTLMKEDYIEVFQTNIVPEADFEVNIVSPLTGDLLQFTYTGTEGDGIESYSWDFGDGIGFSDERNPEYSYSSAGVYDVSLLVIDYYGDADTAVKEEYITVIEDLMPLADFTSNTQVIQNGFIDFTYTGSEGNGIESYSWHFGDGSELSTERNPTHQFLEVGLFTVSLTVVDTDLDESTVTKVDYITVEDDLEPIADFTSDFQTVISDDIIQFTFTGEEGNGPATFWWDFGDGSTSEDRDPIYQYYDPGFYTISLTVVDIDNDESTVTKFDYIEVLEDLFPFTHFMADPTEAYTGDLIQFTFLGNEGNSPAEFYWEFGDGSTSTEQNPSHLYSESGVFSVILTVTDIDGDVDAIEFVNYITIEENLLPIADFSADLTNVVVGDLIQFSFEGTYGNDPNEFYWDFGDGTTSSEENPSHQYDEPGIYTVNLTIIDSNGDENEVIKVEYIIVEDEFPMMIALGGAVGAIALISTGVFISKRRALS